MRRLIVVVLVIVAGHVLSACSDRVPGPTGEFSAAPSPTTGSGCGTTFDFETGPNTFSLEVGKTSRYFILHAPPDPRPEEKLPVVVILHGRSGQANWMLEGTGFDSLASTERFLVVAPQGIGRPTQWDFETSLDEDSSDFRFLSDLIERVTAMACVDRDRLYAAGFSNGSAIATLLPCRTDVTWAAVGGVGGIFGPEACDHRGRAPLVYLHGTADQIVPYTGGPTPIGTIGAVQRTLQAWAAHAGCRPDPSESVATPGTVVQDWGPCDAGLAMHTYVLDHWGHTWPRPTADFDVPDATAVLWEFFQAHPLR